MERIQRIGTGNLICFTENGSNWRIIYTNQFEAVMIAINDNRKREWKKYAIDVLVSMLLSEDALFIEESPVVFDINNFTNHEKENFVNRKAFIKAFENSFGPTYAAYLSASDNGQFRALYQEYGFSKDTANRIVLRWLRSGMSDSALLDKRHNPKKKVPYKYTRKPGRKPNGQNQGMIITPEVMLMMDYGIELYRRSRLMTKDKSYLKMLAEYFAECTEDGEYKIADTHPTLRQYLRYMNKKISRKENEIIKTSKKEQRNSSRILIGSTRSLARHPGAVLQVDALEADLKIVSVFNEEQNVGRPIVYFMTDLYSHCITAFSVGFENNSLQGFTDCLMNLFEDKEVLLREKGIKNADISCIPPSFVPEELWCDRGAEYKSAGFAEICNRLGIEFKLQSGAMGSMKGMVEQAFHQFQESFRSELEHKGVIQKRYDSNHDREAFLSIDEVFNLVLAFVIYFNNHSMKGIRLTKDMINRDVMKTPISLWNYGCEYKGEPSPVTKTNRAQKLFSLMTEARATISREGIKLDGLIYLNYSDKELLKAVQNAKAMANMRTPDGRKINSMIVRFDQRSINTLYYERDGELKTMSLLSPKCGDLCDMTWDEYHALKKIEKQNEKKGEEMNEKLKITLFNQVQNIAESIKREHYASANGIRAARAIEKEAYNFAGRIDTRLDIDDAASSPVETAKIDNKKEIEINNETPALLRNDFPEELSGLID